MSKLLIVDDRESQRRRYSSVAKDAGFKPDDITAVEGWAETSELISHEDFDLALVDLYLATSPGEVPDGLKVIASLRKRFPYCKIIAITGGEDWQELGSQSLKSGANDFVSTHWQATNYPMLLCHRLILWRGAAEGLQYAADG